MSEMLVWLGSGEGSLPGLEMAHLAFSSCVCLERERDFCLFFFFFFFCHTGVLTQDLILAKQVL
jgi:hypothetical protein